jgi:glutamate synthase domain-containing protein 2
VPGVPLWLIVLIVIIAVLLIVAIHDVLQRRHAVLRNFPVIGHLRYLIEAIGPELRQYVVADNEEERPFSRDQRRWVYSTAKKENPYFGFGTDNDLDQRGHILYMHAPFPLADHDHENSALPCTKVMGAWRGREYAFRPPSVINISAMSFGSLSGPAVQALNEGAAQSGCLHNTGEGGISSHHLHGGDLMMQIGTGYFGARANDGSFSMKRLLDTLDGAPVKAIEIKLSQGAKPGMGGLLPGAKVTKEIAAARGVPVGEDVRSPAAHREFSDVAGLIDFVESIAGETGLPVGIKSAVGQEYFWTDLAQQMADTGKGPDFISVDGSEGGTGAAPLVFADHVALPFWYGFPIVHAAFTVAGLQHDVVFGGAGRLGLPADAAMALNLGVDLINVAREPMLAIGCVQAQKCHTGHCPTGVATQNAWLQRGLDPTSKGVRMSNYVLGLRAELLRLSHACGVCHPTLIDPDGIRISDGDRGTEAAHDWFAMHPGSTKLNEDRLAKIQEAMAASMTTTH